ncbi:MAG: flagellar operon protein [Solirubrobacterales bacterium]|nr:flagellar operon protein [Solirubrobacterales bacterium]
MSPIGHNPALVPPGVGAPSPVITGDPARGPGATTGAPTRSFDEVLAQHSSSLRFSGHAIQRLQRRSIDLDQSTLQRLDQGVDRAAAKGSRESVVFVDDTAFVVSVRNRTVITAVDNAHMRDQVFTNIDSAVIA